MAKNILITPSPTGTTNPSIEFSGETAKMITLEVLSGGTLAFNSSGGTMFSIDDTTTGSLFSVNDISGLPILEVFSDDRLVAGKFGTDAFVVSGTNVNINGTLIATGTSYLNTISATTINADTIYADAIEYDPSHKTVYLTYSGASGTSSGTMGVTLTSPGNWTVTEFNTVYFLDDTAGNLTITIPDSDATNLGKIMIVSKPRLVQSGNLVLIKTVSNQAIAETATFYLRSPNDRAEIISVPFVSNGAAGYKYRVNVIGRSIHESLEVSIGGTQLFSDIKSAVDYVNTYSDGPRRIKINPGTYNISETIEVNSQYPIVIEGFGTEITKLSATSMLSGKPMFEIKSEVDFKGFGAYGLSGHSSIDDECCFDCSTPNLYTEIHQCYVDGFYKAIEIEGETEMWVFDSILQNCVYGIWVKGGRMGASELTISDNLTSVYFNVTGNTNALSIQNTIFQINSGQTGINYVDDTAKPEYHFATSNAFYGDGTYISGVTFTSKTQSDIRYEDNAGLQNYRPEAWMWVENNSGSTTISVAGTYSAATILSGNVREFDYIKFTGESPTAKFVYLPSINRKGRFSISGDISVGATNQTLSVALFKNNSILQNIDVRATNSSQPYPFSFTAINSLSENDVFEIRVSNLLTTNAPTLRTLMYSISTI